MRIDRKNEALDAYEKIIDELNSHFGIHMTNVNAWPTLVDRLSALDRRLEYRTVYAAMCSQAHHDAEDILNNFINVPSGRGIGDIGIIIPIGLRPHKGAGNAFCHALSSSAWRFLTRILAPT